MPNEHESYKNPIHKLNITRIYDFKHLFAELTKKFPTSYISISMISPS